MYKCMQRQTQSRTVIAILMLIALIFLNTTLGAGFQLYSAWFAWVIYGVGVALMFVVLRFPQRFSAGTTFALLTVPFLVALLGAFLNV